MRRALALTLLMLTACAPAAQPLPPAPRATATPAPPPVNLPRDAEPHDALTEWWYVTGHLRSADAREFGFEFTIFQSRREGTPAGYLAHFAVSDVGGQRFSHQARFTQASPANGLPLQIGDWSLRRDGDAEVIEARMLPGPGADPGFELQLRLVDEKPAALHHGGYIDMGALGGSYYYSRTRLRVGGHLREVGAEPNEVRGQAWMDHQWGNFVVAGAGGWDWYALQLDDRTELMLYVLRGPAGDVTAAYGSHVLADGSVRDVGPGEVAVEALGRWTSPHTGAVYPSGWSVRLADGRRLVLTPRLLDQELYFPDGTPSPVYWEGAVTIEGDQTGLGYVELTGYAGT
jgi:predicted secreted hydrolase